MVTTRRRAAEAAAPASPSPAALAAKHGLSPLRTRLALAYHLALAVLYAAVLAWHFSPAGASLSGATGFGRFFRYMTFCSFVAQLAVWLLNVTSAASASPRLAAAADDASCAVLPLATAVTILFYALVFAGGPGLVIESTAVGRPRWLSPTMHLCNAAFAWADLALCAGRRSFSAAARKACVGLFVAYAVWQLVVRLVVGSYSYPVLNALPHPWGWVGAAAVGRGFAGAGLAAGAAFTRAARLLTGGAAAARARGG